MTFNDIVSEGLLIAGNTTLTSRMNVALKAWLRSQYSGFLWPFCRQEVAGIAVGTGVQRLTFGNGVGGVTPEIQRINDPLKLYDGAHRTLRDVRIGTDWGVGFAVDDVANDSSINRGLPSRARVMRNTAARGRWDVVFDVAANAAYLMEMSCYVVPPDPAGTDIPLYPNDRTLLQAVVTEAARYGKDKVEYQNQLRILISMVGEDRLKYVQADGVNDTIGLDTRIFR